MANEETVLEKTQAAWDWKNRLMIWLNTIIMTVILVVIIVFANVISKDHFFRHDITSEQTHAISEETKKMLGALNIDIKVYLAPISEVAVRYNPNLIGAHEKVKALLDEYRSFSTHITVQPLTEATAEVAKRLENITIKYNDILFVCGEKSKAVDLESVFKSDRLSGRIIEFSAERAFTSAIKEVTAKEDVKFYFTKGHGEANIKDPSREDSLSFFIKELETRENWKAEELSLVGRVALPDDAKALFIVDPENPFSPDELKVVKEYVENGGKLFVVVSPISKCGLESFLEDYGVLYEKSLVLEGTIFGLMTGITVDEFPPHAINSRAGGERVQFELACPVEQSTKENPNVIATPIAYVNRDSVFAKSDLSFLADSKKRVGFDPKTDRTGKINLGISVEAAGKAKDHKPARIIVIGAKLFLVNKLTTSPVVSNVNYAINCIRWLMEKEEQISIPPKEFKLSALKLKPQEENKIFWLSIAVFPSIGIILGIAAWVMRRK